MKSIVQVLNVVVASGLAAATREFRITLDSEYDVCEGFYAIQNTGGGLTTQWKAGVKDDSRTYQDIVNGLHFQVSTSLKIADRFYKDQPIPAKGRIVKITLVTFETTTSDLNIDFLFLLKKAKEVAAEPNKINC